MLAPWLSRISLRCGEMLETGGAPSANVYFPETVLVAVELAQIDTGVGLIGREGIVGWAGLVGSGPVGHRARVMMGKGSSLVMPVNKMRQACYVSPTLAMSLLCFVQTFAMQMSWSLISVRSDSIIERLSRLLLMIHDRIEGDEIPATHRALAAHLGVRRSTITDTLHIFEGRRALHNERGRVSIRDRSLIETLAGSSYAIQKDLAPSA